MINNLIRTTVIHPGTVFIYLFIICLIVLASLQFVVYKIGKHKNENTYDQSDEIYNNSIITLVASILFAAGMWAIMYTGYQSLPESNHPEKYITTKTMTYTNFIYQPDTNNGSEKYVTVYYHGHKKTYSTLSDNLIVQKSTSVKHVTAVITTYKIKPHLNKIQAKIANDNLSDTKIIITQKLK